MKSSLLRRIIACFVILTVTALSALAEQPAVKSESSGEKAFLRGGSAISEALHERAAAPKTLIPAKASLPTESATALPSPQTEGKHRRLMLWIGIAVTGTIAVYLIQRSVRNHGHIFGSGV